LRAFRVIHPRPATARATSPFANAALTSATTGPLIQSQWANAAGAAMMTACCRVIHGPVTIVTRPRDANPRRMFVRAASCIA